MGKEKKHKEKDKNREHKKKRKHKSRSRSRDRSEKKHKHRDRSHERESKRRKRDTEKGDKYETYEQEQYGYDEQSYAGQSSNVIPGLGDISTPVYEYVRDVRDAPQEAPKLQYDYGHGLKPEPTDNSNSQYAEYYEEGEIPSEFKEEPGMEPVVPSGYEDSPMDPDTQQSGGKEVSLSIEETNKLRAKLGLKPLDVSDSKDEKSSKKEDVHVPAINLREKKKSEELKNKLLLAKEKRKINQMLGKVKTLGEESDDDDALAWVKRSRKLEKEKQVAEKRAKLLDEMDNEFGIGNLVEEEFGVKKNTEYSSKDLRGLKVQHDESAFKEGKTVILTLQDKGVLDEDDDEVLVNVNMMDDERAVKNIENKKAKPDYNPYDEEFDEYGMPKAKQILSKYSEEIDGEKKKTFKLGGGGQYQADHERLMRQMQQDMNQQKQGLSLPPPTIASEYYTEEEMTSFKKVKKKVRKVRKKPKMVTADDLLPLNDDGPASGDLGNRRKGHADVIDPELLDVIEKSGSIPGLDFVADRPVKTEDNPLDDDEDVSGPQEDLTGVVLDDEAGVELQAVIEKSRKLKLGNMQKIGEKAVMEQLSRLPAKQEDMDSDSDAEDKLILNATSKLSGGLKANIILNQTSEFCRALGEIPTYGQAGNRIEDQDELMDFERELAEERRRKEEEEDAANNPGWKQVEIDTAPVELGAEDQSVLEEEPIVAAGVGAALQLATKKGYLVTEKLKSASTGSRRIEMEAKNYSIEDKRYEDLDDKYRKRDRFVGGMVSDFKEKEGYKPEVKLDYVDEMGREMSQKEAFRYLSHRFHGKGSGKMKTEKRKKKIDEEQLMKSMSSTDTPLGTASMLEEKLSREKTPYLVLSGGNKALTGAHDHIAK